MGSSHTGESSYKGSRSMRAAYAGKEKKGRMDGRNGRETGRK